MSKIFTVVALLAASNTFAQESILKEIISTKERVRLSLWYDGLQKIKKDKKEKKKMPIELSEPLGTQDI